MITLKGNADNFQCCKPYLFVMTSFQSFINSFVLRLKLIYREARAMFEERERLNCIRLSICTRIYTVLKCHYDNTLLHSRVDIEVAASWSHCPRCRCRCWCCFSNSEFWLCGQASIENDECVACFNLCICRTWSVKIYDYDCRFPFRIGVRIRIRIGLGRRRWRRLCGNVRQAVNWDIPIVIQ